MISANFLWGNVLHGGKHYESALCMKSVSMPLISQKNLSPSCGTRLFFGIRSAFKIAVVGLPETTKTSTGQPTITIWLSGNKQSSKAKSYFVSIA